MRVTWRGTCDTLERLDVASTEIYRDLAAQNVLYLEMSIGIGAYPYPPAETLAAFKNGIPDGLTVRISGGLSRDRDFKLIHDAGTAYATCGALNGLDLHGLESEGDPRMFLDLYEMGRERGLILKAHAGEMSGPDSIVSILDSLNVKRIEHGVRGIESDALVQRYIDEDITLDLCPWSNVKLGVYPDLKCHPVRDLHRRGVRVTVNTDDPTPFGQTLTEEYSWLLTERVSTSVRFEGLFRKNFDGADSELNPMMAPMARTDMRGGDSVNLGLGMLWLLQDGSRLNFEWVLPIHQDLDGVQLETDHMMFVSWSKAW